MDMITEFPQMNGPYAPKFEDKVEIEGRLAEYSIGRSLIYVGFSWSQTEAAYEATSRLAVKHKVGFFDVSSDKSAAYIPDESGKLILLHEN
jgi:hypothetical protein